MVRAGEMIFSEKPESNGELPEWFLAGREEAWKTFQSLPMPSRKDEDWRFSNLKELDLEDIGAAAPVDDALAAELVGRSNLLGAVTARLIFANDRLIGESASGIPGLTVLPFEEALKTHGDLLEKHFMTRQTELGSEKFSAWHRAVMRSGVFLHIDKGVEVEDPIEVYHWMSGENVAVFPHTLILAEPNAKVRLVNQYHTASEADYGVSVGVSDVVVGEGADVWLLNCQNFSSRSRQIQMTTTALYRDAVAKTFLLDLGSAWTRSELVTHLLEEGGSSEMLSAAVLSGDQQVDQRTLQRHEAPHTSSDLLFKNALFEKGRSIFSGLIQVDDNAHYTDAYQTCRNLLGSNEAEANSMPGLEINADQVKCSHGSTAGQVDEEELFYLESRGIDPATSRELISFGFTKEVVERIGDDAIEAMVVGLVEEKFRALRF